MTPWCERIRSGTGPSLAPAGCSGAPKSHSCPNPDLPGRRPRPQGLSQAPSAADLLGWVDLTREPTQRRGSNAREGTAFRGGQADTVINLCSPANPRSVKQSGQSGQRGQRGSIDLTGWDGHSISTPRRGSRGGGSISVLGAGSPPMASPLVYDPLSVVDGDRYRRRHAGGTLGAGGGSASTRAQPPVHEVVTCTSPNAPSEALRRHEDPGWDVRVTAATLRSLRGRSDGRVSCRDVSRLVDGPARAIDGAGSSGAGSGRAASIDLTDLVRSPGANPPPLDGGQAGAAAHGDARALKAPEPRHPIGWQHERGDLFAGDTDEALPYWKKGDEVQLGPEGAACPPHQADAAVCISEKREEQARSEREWAERQRRTGERRDMLDILKRM